MRLMAFTAAALCAATAIPAGATTYMFTGENVLANTSFTYTTATPFTTQTYLTGQTCTYKGVTHSDCGLLFNPAGSGDFTVPGGQTITSSGNRDSLVLLDNGSSFFQAGAIFKGGALDTNGIYEADSGWGTLVVSNVPPPPVTYSFVGQDALAGTRAIFTSAAPITTQTYLTGQTCIYKGVTHTDCALLFSPAGSGDFTVPGGQTITSNGSGDSLVLLDNGSIFFQAGGIFDDGALGKDGVYEANSGWATLTVAGVPAAVPEPASWALFVGGFGVAGAALRRRRPVGSPAV